MEEDDSEIEMAYIGFGFVALMVIIFIVWILLGPAK
jgi:hypothetical protein